MNATTVLRRLPKQLGFTLVELLLYMGLLMIFISGLTTLFLSSLETQLEGQAVSMVAQEGQYMLQRLEYDVYRADAITTPAPGIAGATLVLSIGGQNYTYQFLNNQLLLSTGGVTEQLHRNEITLSNGYFQRVSDGSSFDSLRVTFTASAGAAPPRTAEERSFATTIGVR